METWLDNIIDWVLAYWFWLTILIILGVVYNCLYGEEFTDTWEQKSTLYRAVLGGFGGIYFFFFWYFLWLL